MRTLGDRWRQELRQRPAVARLAGIGVGVMAAGASLAAIQLLLLAQLVAGLALLPLTMAAYLRLLPPPPWLDDHGDGGGPGPGGDDPGDPPSDGDPEMGIDWERFEQQLREYVEQRQLSAV